MTKRQAEGVQRALQRLQQAIERGETERVLRERQWQRNFRRALQTEGERSTFPSGRWRGYFSSPPERTCR